MYIHADTLGNMCCNMHNSYLVIFKGASLNSGLKKQKNILVVQNHNSPFAKYESNSLISFNVDLETNV